VEFAESAIDRGGEPALLVGPPKSGKTWAAVDLAIAICAAAKVPTLPPQALRRTQATLATDAGATGLMVAQHLGHATGAAPAVTHRSYVERDAARDAAVQRGLRVLQGGGQRPAPDPGSVETTVETHPAEGAAAMAK